jgi:predicted Zn finger-like uncharacterized protein
VFTQCPDCGTVFRVTATVLRAARGQVRCGVCDATFDALQYLTEEIDAEGGEADAGAEGAPGPRGPAPTGDTAPHQALAEADDGPADAAALEDDEYDEDDDPDEDDELADAATEERILEAAARDDWSTLAARDAFPLEELDDPIDVIAPPGAGPVPEFPPYASEPETEPAHGSAFSPAPEALPAGSPPREVPAFFVRAGRTTPSADEDRALAEIAAALARGAQAPAALAGGAPMPGAAAPTDTAATPAGRAGAAASAGADEFVDLGDVPALDVDLLDASAAENIVLEGGEEIPDSALEFDLPAEEWDRVFVPDAAAPTIPPLDAALVRARDEALREPPPTRPGAPADDEEFEFELDEYDGDLDEDDLREPGSHAYGQPREPAPAAGPSSRPASSPVAPPPAGAATPRPPPAEDPLALTDEFPPLRVTRAEEAAAGLADTPDAKPRTGVAPEDFDALVAAAAARAAAEVAARVAATAAAGTGLRAAAPAAGAAVAAVATGDLRRAPQPAFAPVAEPVGTAPAEADDGGAEATWFDARRDIAPEGAPIAQAEPDELISFDAQRFQAIARGPERRPWWATTLYALGAVVLGLALLAQAGHYWRDSLAQHPVVGPPLQDAYARLGLPLEPEWNLAAYEVKQWGATSDVAPGTLRVRASVVNRAPRAQPHPLLRVTLLDRFSGKVARREFQPAEYLPGRAAPGGLLAPGARVDADLVIADPGSEAVGFELDVCLVRRGALTCGGDARLAGP